MGEGLLGECVCTVSLNDCFVDKSATDVKNEFVDIVGQNESRREEIHGRKRNIINCLTGGNKMETSNIVLIMIYIERSPNHDFKSDFKMLRCTTRV